MKGVAHGEKILINELSFFIIINELLLIITELCMFPQLWRAFSALQVIVLDLWSVILQSE